MATLQKIRQKGPLVAIVIGVALLLFILGDIFRSGSALFRSAQNVIAEVAGTDLDARDYYNRVQELEAAYKAQGQLDAQGSERLRQQVWEEMLQSTIMENQLENLGLTIEYPGYTGISPEEISDMVNGKNIDPIIRNIFTNRQTGVFNPADVTNFLRQTSQSTNPQGYQEWLQIEQELLKKRINEKYYNLIRQGLYVTSFEAKEAVKETNTKQTIQYVGKSINSIPDSSVTVSESDIQKYYDEHGYLFQQNVSRDVAYVSFNIVPSSEDSAKALKDIKSIYDEFVNSKDPLDYARMNSDLSVSDRYLTKEQLGSPLDTLLFDKEVGSIYGPFLNNSVWIVAKLVDKKEVYDSINAAHILIAKNPQTGDMTEARAKIDSLKSLIEKGADFAAIASQNSQDQGSAAKGGNLGWFNQGVMVPEFDKACQEMPIKGLKVVESQYGVHLIKLLDRKNKVTKVQVAMVSRVLDASEQTRADIYKKASKFAIESDTWEKFNENIKKYKYQRLVANNILPSAKRFAGIENAHDLIRSIYASEKGKIILNVGEKSNPVFEEGDRYIVAYLTEIKEKGVAPLNLVKNQIEVEVRKQKKLQLIADEFNSKLNGVKDITAFGNALNLPVRIANDVNFSGFQVPGMGLEPKVNAVSFVLPENKISKPIKGLAGVYVITVIGRQNAVTDVFSNELSKLVRDLKTRASYQVYQALKENANIKDYRYKF